MENSDVVKQYVAMLVRLIGLPVITWLAAKGHISSDEATSTIITVVTVMVMLVWSVWQKVAANNKVATALNVPAGTSPATLNNVIANQ